VSDISEQGNKHLGSIKGEKFLDSTSDYQLLGMNPTIPLT